MTECNRSLSQWIIAAVVGFTAAYLLSLCVAQYSGELRFHILQVILGGVCGAIIGGCQAWYFHKHGPPIAKAWVADNILGWVVGSVIQIWALKVSAEPILKHFGNGIGTTMIAQAIMGAAVGFPVTAAQTFRLARFMPDREWKRWFVLGWSSFVLAGVAYALFVRFSQALLPGLPGNAVLLTLGWALKGAVVGVLTGKALPRTINA